jgi:lipooligosaccharide transport system ATP-binding protein
MLGVESGDDLALVATDLRKYYGEARAVAGVSFQVEKGEFVGILGPNGAGKSTLMRMIGATARRSGGDLRVLGLDPRTDSARIRARIGVVPQQDNLDSEITVRQNLSVYGRYFALPRRHIQAKVDELLDFIELRDRADASVDTLSGGMKRRLTIARALVNTPELVLLDEPTTGLDPQARHVVWSRLFELKRSAVTLVLTTHYMDEAEQLCDRIIIMNEGRIVDSGVPADLIRNYATREVVELRFAEGSDDMMAEVKEVCSRVETLPDRILAYVDDGEEALWKMHQRGVRPASSLVRRASLEDVFLRLAGRELIE